MPYTPQFHPDGRKVYDPQRTERDIHDEWAALTAQVKADDPDCRFPEMRAKELWRQQEETAERWSEWQQRVWFPRMRALAAAKPDRNLIFTIAELENMAERYAMANDPVSQSIMAKVAKALSDVP